MWLFLSNSFLSIVQPPDRDDVLLVRARVKGDIERVWPDARVSETLLRDYRYRAFIPRKLVADAIAKRVMENTATNFKNSVEENLRHDAYARVWGVMFGLQNQLNGRTIKEHEKANPRLSSPSMFPDDEFDFR